MISCKHISKVIAVMMTAAVVFCMWLMLFPKDVVEVSAGVKTAMEYESALFDTENPIQIDIQMAEGDWEEMLENATAEKYYSCDVLINDQKLYHVGIRPKGNTSLTSIASNPDTDRFSLKLEFDHYVEGQTCCGLDKLILNNNYADATNMKEAVIYDMYQYLGADASLYNYAKISVNGEYWGVYLALEAVEESFLTRNYGTSDGKLYKPDSMNMGEGPDGKDFGGQPPQPDAMRGPDFEKEGRQKRGEKIEFGGDRPSDGEAFAFTEEEGRKPPDGGKAFEKGHSMGGANGANLNYTDDEIGSYSDIWEGEITDTGKKDHRRVVTALKNISKGTDLEDYLDVDNVLKYMAVHVFSVNLDSLSGNMAHNYYLYEQNGRLNILPWDYNLSFGGMNAGPENSAAGMVNDAVDTPFQGTEFFDALLENEEYLGRYHEYLQQLIQEYVFGGGFEKVYGRIRSQIDELVATDPTALYSYEEYEEAAGMLYQTVLLRAESVQGQLDGTIPSTDEGQKEDASALVDASMVDIDIMGTFDKGKGRAGGR